MSQIFVRDFFGSKSRIRGSVTLRQRIHSRILSQIFVRDFFGSKSRIRGSVTLSYPTGPTGGAARGGGGIYVVALHAIKHSVGCAASAVWRRLWSA